MTDNMGITPEVYNRTIALVRENGTDEEVEIIENFLLACFIDTTTLSALQTLLEFDSYALEVLASLKEYGYDIDETNVSMLQ